MEKLLFMINCMNIGGVEKSLLSLLSAIPKDKYKITVLMLQKNGGFLEYIPDGIEVKEVNWFKDIKPIIIQSPQATIKKYLKERKYIEIITFVLSYFISKKLDDRSIYYKNLLRYIPKCEEEYDVAVSFEGPMELIDSYIAYKVKAKKKIAWVHFDISKYKVNNKLYRHLYKRFNKIFIVSNEAKIKLEETIPIAKEKSEVFLNIISKDLILDMANEEVKFDNKFIGKKIVTVGRLSKEKGQDLAINVLLKLKNDGYKVRWYCVGEGTERERYEKLILENNLQNDFILLGQTANPYPYIKEADIYVQPSRHEAYCLTLTEAKCLQKPIVTTNFTGAYEQIKDHSTGIIVECDTDSLYEKIKYLLDNEEEQKRLKKNLSREIIDTKEEINKLYSYISS